MNEDFGTISSTTTHEDKGTINLVLKTADLPLGGGHSKQKTTANLKADSGAIYHQT